MASLSLKGPTFVLLIEKAIAGELSFLPRLWAKERMYVPEEQMA